MSTFQNIPSFNRALEGYLKYSGKTFREAILKQSMEVGWYVSKQLRALKPTPEKIKAGMDAAIAKGKGIRIRESAREWVRRKYNVTKTSFGREIGTIAQKRMTKVFFGKTLRELMIERERAIRSSAAGFLGVSARYPRRITGSRVATGRRGRPLSAFKVHGSDIELINTSFEWGAWLGNVAESALEGVSKPAGMLAIERGIANATQNMLIYISRKQAESLQRLEAGA